MPGAGTFRLREGKLTPGLQNNKVAHLYEITVLIGVNPPEGTRMCTKPDTYTEVLSDKRIDVVKEDCPDEKLDKGEQ